MKISLSRSIGGTGECHLSQEGCLCGPRLQGSLWAPDRAWAVPLRCDPSPGHTLLWTALTCPGHSLLQTALTCLGSPRSWGCRSQSHSLLEVKTVRNVRRGSLKPEQGLNLAPCHFRLKPQPAFPYPSPSVPRCAQAQGLAGVIWTLCFPTS